MIIDTHQHVFWHGRDDAGLVADLDEHGIDVAWLLSWVIAPDEDASNYHGVLDPVHLRGDGTHRGIPLDSLIRCRDRFPSRFVLGYCPHPLLGDAPSLLEAAYHIHQVRVCGEWKFRIPFDDPRCINLFRKAGELKCPIVLHLDVPYVLNASTGERAYAPSWYGGTVDNLERALEACPDATFIGHAPGFWREISGDADDMPGAYPADDRPVTPGGRLHEMFDRFPNLYADMSAGSGLKALSRDRSHAHDFITRYADRLLFARDYYGGDLHAFLQSLDLSQDVLDKIYFKNAQELVPLGTGLKAADAAV